MYLLIRRIAGSAADKPGQNGGVGGRKCEKIYPGKSKVVSHTTDRVKGSLNYILAGQRIPDASSCI